MTARERLSPRRWPRLMRIGVAAEYVSVPRDRFRATVPIAAIKVGPAELWDREALDRWVDSLSGAEQPIERKRWLDSLDEADRVGH